MFNIALYQPEIPPNTGNIIRLCANTGCTLHLIHPLGFSLDDKHLRRAGLDYHQHVIIFEHDNFEQFLLNVETKSIYAIETSGDQNYSEVHFKSEDTFLFGSETRGLPPDVLNQLNPKNILKVPMQVGIRSINLSNTVAIVLYEAWRQNEFNKMGSGLKS